MFEHASRYRDLESRTHVDGDGREVVYVSRRLLPPQAPESAPFETAVRAGDRPDHLAARTIGDPERFWQICDANGVMEPFELTDSPGRLVRTTLPEP